MIKILLSKCSISNNLRRKENEYVLISWRITVTIPRPAQILLSKLNIKNLLKHSKSVPGLYSDLMETMYRVNCYCNQPLLLIDSV